MTGRWVALIVSGVLLAVVAVVLVIVLRPTFAPPPESGEATKPRPAPSREQSEPPPVTECPDPTVTVRDASDLQEALAAAAPGDSIVLEDGVYPGNFVAENSGDANAPITLCGSAEAILQGGGVDDGYVFHLDHASYWHLLGFSVRNGQKGVMADGTVGSVIQGLTVTGIGDEAIHLRRFSTDSAVIGNTISDTGLRRAKFGEGIYVGTAESNWCDISDCEPDRSDRNTIEGNTIVGTRSEAIDIKEGTADGRVVGNRFDGGAIVEADSWVDVKGNDWIIENNEGVNSPGDGFQTHEILDQWGDRNVFRDNSAAVNGPGYGFALTPEKDNVIECSNSVSGARSGLSNVACG